MKKTITTTAWATSENFLSSIYDENSNSDNGIGFSSGEMQKFGWIKIGTAILELDLIDPKSTVNAQIETLESEIQRVQFETEITLNMLRSKINNLLAIEG